MTPRLEAARRLPERAHPVRYGLLLGTVLASFAIQGALAPGSVQQVVVTALLGCSLLLAFWAAELRPRLMRAAAVIAIAALTVSVARASTGGVGDGATRLMDGLLVALGPPAVALGVMRNLRSSGQVKVEAVAGVLCFYVLLGMFFAFVYGAIDRLGGNPFFAQDVSATIARCLYFSFTTLATVGYGDLTARTDLGHTLSVFEALVGQIYLVTVVSLIISNLGRRGRQEQTQE